MNKEKPMAISARVYKEASRLYQEGIVQCAMRGRAFALQVL